MKKLTVPAAVSELERVLEFIDTELEANECPPRIIMQLNIAVEEIFVNIAHYAYNPEVGFAEIVCEVGGEPLAVTVQFTDGGKPYDPLAKRDPDLTLTAEERQIGGLGIYMVKKSMDDVAYSYESGKNVLTIKKHL